MAYYFPPDGGAGSQRPAKFAKYLCELGWEVDVLTKEETNFGRWNPRDGSLSSEIPPQSAIHRIADPQQHSFFASDQMEGWSKKAMQCAAKLSETRPYDAVLITMSPFSTAKAALGLIRSNPALEVYLDLRDPWIFDGWHPKRTLVHWLRDYYWMNRAFSKAAGVIFNTNEAEHVFKKYSLTTYRSTVITNGFDELDFQCEPSTRLISPAKRFLIVHTGALHAAALKPNSTQERLKALVRTSGEKIYPAGRTLLPLISALQLLQQQNWKPLDQLNIRCVGVATDEDKGAVERANLSDIFEFTGYVNHQESVRLLMEADALLLLLHGVRAGSKARIVPGKTYEYIRANKPILACVPAGDARDIVASSESNVICDPTSPLEIANGIKALHEAHFPGNPSSDGSNDGSSDGSMYPQIHRYERKSLAKQLASFLGAGQKRST